MRALLGLVLLAGCSAGAAEDALMGADTGMEADTTFEVGALRVDVTPPAGLAEPEVLPQSHILESGPVTGAELALYPTVVWTGTLTGEVTRGWSSAVEVPTTTEPLAANFTATVTGTRLGGSVQSDEDGRFSLPLPAYDDPYTLAVVPLDADLAPFHVESRLFRSDVTQDIPLDVGTPVYGRVTDATGAGIPHVEMRIVRTDLADEVASARFETDATGWYVARVESTGDYAVEVTGGLTHDDDPRVVPTLRTDVVVEDPASGAAVYVDVGTIEDASAQGYVYDTDDNGVAGCKVRLTAEALDGATGTLVVETETTSSGRWGVDLLPGTYTVDVIPPYDVLASPSTYEGFAVHSGGNDFGTLRVGEPTTLSGSVDGAAGALVQAKQVGYDRYVYQTTTDKDGRFSMDVPAGDFVVTFSPPSGSEMGAMTYETLTAPGDYDVALEAGEALSGVVTWQGEGVGFALVEVYDVTTGVLVGRGSTGTDGSFSLFVPQMDDTQADTAE